MAKFEGFTGSLEFDIGGSQGVRYQGDFVELVWRFEQGG